MIKAVGRNDFASAAFIFALLRDNISGDIMVYTVTLNPALDYYLTVANKSDDVHIAEKAVVTYGGKGINVSVVLKRLGIENKAIGFYGGFSGKKLKTLLQDKVDFDFVNIDGDTRINVKISGVYNYIFNADGPFVTLNDERRLLRKLSKIAHGDYLVLSGSVPRSMGSLAYERLLDSVKSKNIKIIADTSGESLKSILKFKPFLVKPNVFELSEFFGKNLKDSDNICAAAQKMQSYGAQNVLVSMGGRGMLLVDENGEIHRIDIIEGDVKNTNGCGDSAVAGFAAGYIMKNDFDYALRLANACANATAFSDGLCSKADVLKLM